MRTACCGFDASVLGLPRLFGAGCGGCVISGSGGVGSGGIGSGAVGLTINVGLEKDIGQVKDVGEGGWFGRRTEITKVGLA